MEKLPKKSTVCQKLLSAKAKLHVLVGSIWKVHSCKKCFTNAQNYECQLHVQRPGKKIDTCSDVLVANANPNPNPDR